MEWTRRYTTYPSYPSLQNNIHIITYHHITSHNSIKHLPVTSVPFSITSSSLRINLGDDWGSYPADLGILHSISNHLQSSSPMLPSCLVLTILAWVYHLISHTPLQKPMIWYNIWELHQSSEEMDMEKHSSLINLYMTSLIVATSVLDYQIYIHNEIQESSEAYRL